MKLVDMYAIARLPTEEEIARYVRGETRRPPKATATLCYVLEKEDGEREVIELPMSA